MAPCSFNCGWLYRLGLGGILIACAIDLGKDVSEFPLHALAAKPFRKAPTSHSAIG